MKTLRKAKSEAIYRKGLKEYSGCCFCNRDLLKVEYTHWQIQKNRYPYDKLSTEMDMLVFKDHGMVPGPNAKKELERILKDLESEYTMFLWNTPRRQSQPQHPHYHLIKT